MAELLASLSVLGPAFGVYWLMNFPVFEIKRKSSRAHYHGE